MVTQLNPVDPSEFKEIVQYIKKHPIENTKYRLNVAPIARSQTFGIVSRRSLCPDLSRSSWKHPLLFKMLMDYANKHVQIPFTSIQVNQNLTCAEHLDKGNIGLSYIVAFSDTIYEGGGLSVENYSYNIQNRPLLFDGSKQRHKTEPFRGNRYSIVFHTINPKISYRANMVSLKKYEVIQDAGIWKVKDVISGSLFWGKHGLSHPLKGRTKTNQTKPKSQEPE